MTQQSHNAYFANLKVQVSGTLGDVQRQLNSHQTKIEKHIQSGRYEIRETDTPVIRKNATSDEDGRLRNLVQAKRDLEGKIHLLESQYAQYNRTTQEDIKRGTAESKVSEKEHQEFVKQMLKSRKELEARRQQRLLEEQKLKKLKQEQRMKQQEQQRLEKEKKKKQEIEQKLKRLNESKEKRSSEFELQNRALSSVISSKPLYQKLENKYLQFEAVSLEQKKKKLAEIRNLHKPISKEEIDEHERKVTEALRQKQREHSRQGTNSASNSQHSLEVYKSAWYKKMAEEQRKQEPKPEDVNLEIAKEKKDKLKQYSEYVRSNFKPEVDENLRKEITTSLHVPKIGTRPEEAKKLGLEYLKFSKQHINQNPGSKTDQNSSTSTNKIPLLPPKPVNYLEQARKNRANSNSEADIIASVSRKPMSEGERAQAILSHASKLEEQAKRKEQLARASNQAVDQQLDDMYMNAIKAKLALLN